MKVTTLFCLLTLSFVTLAASEDDPDTHKGKYRIEDLSQQSPDQLKETQDQNRRQLEEDTAKLAKATAKLADYLRQLHLPREQHKK